MHARFGFLLVTVLALSAPSSATLRPGPAEGRSHQPPSAAFQQHAGHTPGAGAPLLSLAVDGSVDPDSIPDELAYSHFLRAMAASASGAGRQAALTQAGLAPADRAAFVVALGTLGLELSDLARQRQAGGPSLSPAELEQLKTRETEAVAAARQRVELALTGAGLAQLDAHIRTRVKRHIKIYRGPMPSPAPGGAGR